MKYDCKIICVLDWKTNVFCFNMITGIRSSLSLIWWMAQRAHGPNSIILAVIGLKPVTFWILDLIKHCIQPTLYFSSQFVPRCTIHPVYWSRLSCYYSGPTQYEFSCYTALCRESHTLISTILHCLCERHQPAKRGRSSLHYESLSTAIR